MTKIIQADFNGQAMHFTADGWFNATESAAYFGKDAEDWLAQEYTERYLGAMAEYLRLPDTSPLLQRWEGVLWLHPKMSVYFSRWANPEFNVWCTERLASMGVAA